MKHQILHSPSFSVLELTLDEGEQVRAQPDSMLSMTTGVRIAGRVGGTMGGGVKSGVKSVLSGEDFFTAIFTAKRPGERLVLAPAAIGEILSLEVGPGREYIVSRGAFLACEDSVVVELKYGGLKGVLSKKGLFFMKVSGRGHVFLSSFGAVIEQPLAEEEQFVVDNRYVIAFRDTVSFELVKATEDFASSIMSGEGFVNRYRGPGEVYYQTRAKQRAGGLVTSLLNMAT